MKASQQAIERGVKDCLFIDYKRRSGHFDVTTVASIKEITDKVLASAFLSHQILSGKIKWLQFVFKSLLKISYHYCSTFLDIDE